MTFLTAAFLTAAFLTAGCSPFTRACLKPLEYPQTRKVDLHDDYHGTRVPDPYRWLEDPDSDETRAWVAAQNRITMPWLKSIPGRERLIERLTRLWDYEEYGIPVQRGGRYFFTRNTGLQNQSVIYWAESLNIEPRELIDPNTLSDDGTVALARYSFSPDGKWMVYGISTGGSDWSEWHLRQVETGVDLDDHLKWIKFSRPSWDSDSLGFFYGRYDAPPEGEKLQKVNYYQKLYYHRVGTAQTEDRLIYERPDHKEWSFSLTATDDGRFEILSIGRGTERNNLISFREKGRDDGFQALVPEFEAPFRFIDNNGPLLFFKTDLNAPRGRVIAIDTAHPAGENWRTVIPESEEVLRRANVINNTFVATFLKDAHTQVRLFGLDGSFLRDIELPGLCTARGFRGSRDDKETFYRSAGFSDPGTIYRYDMQTGRSEIFRRPELSFDPDDFVTRQIFYPGKDGTKVPMFIVHKKGLEPNPDTPALLYGYGGFNAAISPSFKLRNLVWMEIGGIYAVANIRGGGEYGRAWHDAGKKLNKQNTFDDFIAAAEWLIENNYTSTKKLAIQGASNGGLLVGACMLQRPDLFGACLPGVGVMDMLRFVKFTIGWAWVSDYGSPDDPEEFKALFAYSPCHNIRDGVAYPATLVTTADHDDRVVPAHSFKFTARLQEAQASKAPILIRIETRAGHGAGKPTSKRIIEAADIIAFLTCALRISY